MQKKYISIILILLICFATTYTFAEDEENKNTNTSTDLQTQRNELKNQLDNANSNLEEVQSSLSENLQQVEKLDARIEQAEADLAEQQSKIEELKESIKKTEDELSLVSQKYNKQKKLFEQRMVAIYEAGETRYLDIVLKSKGLSDFLSSYYIVTQLAELDENLLDELETKKKTIDLSKRKLENEKKELAAIAENQTRTTLTLQNTRSIREVFVSRLSQEEQDLQQKIDEINEQYELINKQILALAQEGSISAEYIGGELAWPVPGYTRITSPYSMRVHPITGQYKLHTGVDISAPTGANFIAANDGIVIKAEMTPAYGNMVIIDHGGGISTLYAHGSEILVEVGQQVKRGEAVLKVGSTGYSTGPHAHFEVRIKGITTDPLPYITNGLIPGQENKETTNEQ